MDLGLFTHSVSNLPFDDALDLAAGIGVSNIELAVGDHLDAPRMRVLELLDNPAQLRAFMDKVSSRGLRLGAVNSLGWPRQPKFEEHIGAVRAAIRLAHELQVDKLVAMSGCPGEPPTVRAMNWLPFAWPAEYGEIPADYSSTLEEQWNRTVETWRELADYATTQGIRTVALDLYPSQLVYNVPTLLRFRAQVGPLVGANVDPGVMFWQQMDPIQAVHALGTAVHHVHMNDVQIHENQLALAGVLLNTTPFEEPRQRAWTYRTLGMEHFHTLGVGHDTAFWVAFLQSLRDVGYDDVLSIATRDPYVPKDFGATMAARFVAGLLKVDQQALQS